MPKHGKKYRAATENGADPVPVEPATALARVRELSFANFDETVEAAIGLR